MALPRIGHAGIAHADHVEATVGTVADRVVDALIGQKAGRDDGVDADVAHQVFEVGRIEQAGRRLGNHHLVVARGYLVDYPGIPRPLGDEEVAQLVVEAAITPVAGVVLHHREDDFETGAARRIEQTTQVGNDAGPGGSVEFGAWMAVRLVHDPVLHIDDKKRRARGVDRAIATQFVLMLGHRTSPPDMPPCRFMETGA